MFIIFNSQFDAADADKARKNSISESDKSAVVKRDDDDYMDDDDDVLGDDIGEHDALVELEGKYSQVFSMLGSSTVCQKFQK